MEQPATQCFWSPQAHVTGSQMLVGPCAVQSESLPQLLGSLEHVPQGIA
ncbi:Hypothetical protein A7982_09990 [Minicystis rosea]|nr:Hypothetical protein A7982_09990 [Minicystis rosea]